MFEAPVAFVDRRATAQGHSRASRVSAEVFTIPLAQDRYLIYAPVRGVAFVANASAVNQLAQLSHGGPDDEPDGEFPEFLRRLSIVDAPPEEQPVTSFSGTGPPQPNVVTLFLTTACNLRCTYCYASAGETPTKHMTLDTAKRGIDFVLHNAQRRGLQAIGVNYHGGGEPTVNWKVMTRSLAYARRRASESGIDVVAAAATNGVFNDEQVDWVIANLNGGVSLSFDGLPEVQDAHRVTIRGLGSSSQVMQTMRRFDDAGFTYGIRVTVTHDQISRLPDSIAFICSRFHPHAIQVEPAYQLGRWSTAPSAETEEFVAAYREAQKRAGELGREIGYSAARVGILTNHFCGITQDSFALSADGNVSSCYEAFSEDNEFADIFFYGRPDDVPGGYSFDMTALEHLRHQGVEHRPFCRGCYAKWNCAGDCYHKSLTVNGRGEFVGSERCHITRELVKDQVLAKIADSGGLVWHEPPDQAVEPSGEAGTSTSADEEHVR